MRQSIPIPTPAQVNASIAKECDKLQEQITELQRRLEIRRKASECPHTDLGEITEEDYDGHRTDYLTYSWCKGCGWDQQGKWRKVSN